MIASFLWLLFPSEGVNQIYKFGHRCPSSSVVQTINPWSQNPVVLILSDQPTEMSQGDGTFLKIMLGVEKRCMELKILHWCF